MTSADEIEFGDLGALDLSLASGWCRVDRRKEYPHTECHPDKYQTPPCLWQHVYVLLAWDSPVLHATFTRVGRSVKIYALSYVTDFNDKRYCTEKPVDNLKVICVYSLSCVLCSRAVGKMDVAKSRTKDGLLLIEWYSTMEAAWERKEEIYLEWSMQYFDRPISSSLTTASL